MYKDTSNAELVLIGLFAIAMMPIGIFVNGLMLAYAWQELLIPIFPQLPVIGQWQAVGLSTFASLFTMHLAKVESKDRNATLKTIITGVIVQWALLFLIIWLVSLSY